MDCSSPISMNILLKIPAWLRSCIGTSIPHCNIYCNNPTVLRQTDLPPALGPDIIRIRCFSVNSMSSGTTFLPCLARESCSNGCTAIVQSSNCVFSNAGFIPDICRENKLLARIKSISARNSYDCNTSGMEGQQQVREFYQDTDNFPTLISFQFADTVIGLYYFGRFYKYGFSAC